MAVDDEQYVLSSLSTTGIDDRRLPVGGPSSPGESGGLDGVCQLYPINVRDKVSTPLLYCLVSR